jgi:hypothetical protein
MTSVHVNTVYFMRDVYSITSCQNLLENFKLVVQVKVQLQLN